MRWRAMHIIALAIFWPMSSTGAAVDDTNIPATIRGAAKLIEQGHFSGRPLDDAMSRRWFGEFLARLDPQRLYFLQSDIDEFRRCHDLLDDAAKRGDLAFARLARDRCRLRTKEGARIAAEVVAADRDFTLEEECPMAFDEFAATSEALRERWRLRLKLELLIEKLHGRRPSDVTVQLMGRYERIARDAGSMTDERLCTIYLDALASVYDRHTSYWSPRVVESLNQTMTFSRYGLGFGFRQRGGQFVIVPGAPSQHSPPTPSRIVGWELVAIHRPEGEWFDVVEMHPEDFGKLVGSPSGPLKDATDVVLELRHPVTFERASVAWNRWLRN